MCKLLKTVDFEALTLSQLKAARSAPTPERRRVHLDKASVFATLGEQVRALA
jgi:hypothetical protein